MTLGIEYWRERVSGEIVTPRSDPQHYLELARQALRNRGLRVPSPPPSEDFLATVVQSMRFSGCKDCQFLHPRPAPRPPVGAAAVNGTGAKIAALAEAGPKDASRQL